MLMQEHNAYLPYAKSQTLWEMHRLAYTYTWHLSVTPRSLESAHAMGWVKFLQQALSDVGRDMSIPLHIAGNVVVPNLTSMP